MSYGSGRVRVRSPRVGYTRFLPVKNTIFHDVRAISNVFFVNSRSRSLYVVVRPSVCRLSSICNVRAPILRGLKFSAMFLRHLIRRPSVDIQVKFYGVPKATSPSVELKTRGVAEYSDFGPIERFISETVQDRS